jgi:putative FmdB family regulatory protein
MPIYEYQCRSCGHEYEALQKLSDAPLTECPACFKLDLVKKISAAGFRLKGGGWYETDFKSGTKKNVVGDAASPASATTKNSTPATSSSD